MLTKENYYDNEMAKKYMGFSQIKSFMKCEARAMALLNSEFEEPENDNFLIGKYVHAWNEGMIHEFLENNRSKIFKINGTLKQVFENADAMINTLENDRLCMLALEGEKEVIMSGDIFGVPFKIMIDSYNPERRTIVDLKTTKSIVEKSWIDRLGRYGNFIENYQYDLQMAIYAEIELQNSKAKDYCECLIVAISKETPPDKIVITGFNFINKHEEILENIKNNILKYQDIKLGKTEPDRCECCDYCRATKKLLIPTMVWKF